MLFSLFAVVSHFMTRNELGMNFEQGFETRNISLVFYVTVVINNQNLIVYNY